MIIAESRRLERLVGDLLDLTKLEARQMSITMRPTDAAEVVGTTAEGFRPAAARAGLSRSPCTCRVRVMVLMVAPASVAADPDRLAQLLANLLENAITFARTTVTVTVAPDDRVAGVCGISVDDDGPGVADGRPRPRLRALLPGGPRAQPADGFGTGTGHRGRAGGGHGRTVRAESPLNDDGGSARRDAPALAGCGARYRRAPDAGTMYSGASPCPGAGMMDVQEDNGERAALRAFDEEGHEAARRGAHRPVVPGRHGRDRTGQAPASASS